MRRNHFGAIALLAGTLASGCEGNNGFPAQPFGLAGGESGSIRGQVTANGTGLPGAAVLVANGPSVSTDASGQYRIGGLDEGSYRVSLQVPVGLTLVAGDSAARTVTVARGSPVVVNWRLQGTVGSGTGTGTGTGTTTTP